MGVELKGYSEAKPHRLKRIVWAGCNTFVFPLLFTSGRNVLLRLFGASIGKSLIYRSVKIYAPWNLSVGDWCCIGPGVEIYCKDHVSMGDNVVISQQSYLCTASHDVSSSRMALKTKPISIGDNCWVAAKAVVLPGVSLGEGVVVGCASVVTRDVAPWSVVAGNPAKFIKNRELNA